MNAPVMLISDAFQLEFRTISDLPPLSQNSPLPECLGNDGFVLQERIIVPPDLADRAAEFSAQSVDPSRCNPPLVLIGHPSLPVQYLSLIARSGTAQAKMERKASTVQVTADGASLLFSAPFFSEPERTARSFYYAFAEMSGVLQECGMDETKLVRTWLFLDDILQDYDALNDARKEFFSRWYSPARPFIPASTGIEGHSVNLKPLALQFCAFSGNRLTVRQQASPLQNEATAYGKLFSRCAVVEFPRQWLVYISGTAAIDKAGASLHADDLKKQLESTLKILSAILKEVNGDFSCTAQATVYLKRHKDYDVCLNILKQAGFPVEKSLFLTDTAVCRDDLLCEIELTAVTRPAGPETV